MRVLRALGASLLWIVAGVVGLLGALLSITIILLPLGIPLLFLARKLFRYSMTLLLPRAVRHPGRELGKKGRRGAARAAESAGKKLGRKDRSLKGRLKRAF